MNFVNLADIYFYKIIKATIVSIRNIKNILYYIIYILFCFQFKNIIKYNKLFFHKTIL